MIPNTCPEEPGTAVGEGVELEAPIEPPPAAGSGSAAFFFKLPHLLERGKCHPEQHVASSKDLGVGEDGNDNNQGKH